MWVFFNYPNLYQKIVLPWLYGMPFLTIFTFFFIGLYFLIIFYSTWRRNKKGKTEIHIKEGNKFLLAVFLLLISIVAFLKMPYNDVRYTYYIYPLLLLIVLASVLNASNLLFKNEKSIYSFYFIITLFFVFFSSDFSIYHLINIDSKEVHFRTIYKPDQATVYFFRNDYVTPAEVINKKMSQSDITITTQAPIEYYLKRLDYYYRDYTDGEFSGRSRLGGEKEIWTNANLIYTKKDLFRLIKNSRSTIWLSDFSNKRPGIQSTDKEINKAFSKYIYYVNIDSTINVFKIPPSK